MATLLVRNIDLLATFDEARREIADGALLLREIIGGGEFRAFDIEAALARHRTAMDRIYDQ